MMQQGMTREHTTMTVATAVRARPPSKRLGTTAAFVGDRMPLIHVAWPQGECGIKRWKMWVLLYSICYIGKVDDLESEGGGWH